MAIAGEEIIEEKYQNKTKKYPVVNEDCVWLIKREKMFCDLD